MDLHTLINKCKKNNSKAQKEVFDMYIDKMYNISNRYLNNYDDVQDVLMLSFERIFRAINQYTYNGDKSFDGWIRKIVVNESIRFLMQRKKMSMADEIDQSVEYLAPVDHISYDHDKIFTLIEKLPLGYRTVLSLYVIEEFSHAEIAEKLNISINTSKSQLNKARKHLQELMKKQLGYEKV